MQINFVYYTHTHTHFKHEIALISRTTEYGKTFYSDVIIILKKKKAYIFLFGKGKRGRARNSVGCDLPGRRDNFLSDLQIRDVKWQI